MDVTSSKLSGKLRPLTFYGIHLGLCILLRPFSHCSGSLSFLEQSGVGSDGLSFPGCIRLLVRSPISPGLPGVVGKPAPFLCTCRPQGAPSLQVLPLSGPLCWDKFILVWGGAPCSSPSRLECLPPREISLSLAGEVRSAKGQSPPGTTQS